MARIIRGTGTALAVLAGVATMASGAALADTGTAPVAAPNSGAFLAGLHARETHDYSAAAEFLGVVLQGDTVDLDLLQDSFGAMASAGRFEEAARIGLKLQELGARSDIITLVLLLEDYKAGRLDQAIKAAEGLSNDGLAQFVGPLARAWLEVDAARHDDAIKALAPLGEIDGVKGLHGLHLGLINELAKRPADAEKIYQATAADPTQLSFRLAEVFGNFHERRGEWDKAKLVYEKFAENFPDNAMVGLVLDRLEARKKPKPAITSPRDGLAEAMLNIGSVLSQNSGSDVALMLIRASLDLRSDSAAAQVMLADQLAAMGHYDEAIEVYRGVDRSSPFSWQARLQIAEYLDKMEQVDEAIAQLDDMIAERKEVADAAMLKGDILRGHERFAEAAGAYDTAIERVSALKENHWPLLYYRGIALERSKQWPRAEADFLKALELMPDQPNVLNYLAYSWVELGQNYDRSLEMLNKAVELRPRDGYIVDSLGWVYFRIGQFDKAVTELERAIELVPQDSVVNDHLGDAYWRVGRRNEARFQWQRALNLEPAADQIAPIQSKISNGLPNSSGT
ncbi:MAG: tetratricopeptide repeat protein [Dongiaceae bacterium]